MASTAFARAARPLASRFLSRAAGFSARPQPMSMPVSMATRAFSARSAFQVKKFTSEHEWIDVAEGGKTGIIGISDYAAHALGDVVYVELPAVDAAVEAGDGIGAVESVKSASDINSPVTCTVKEVNALLEEKPGTINRAAEDAGAGGGWIAKVEIGEQGTKDLDGLMDAAAYKEFSSE